MFCLTICEHGHRAALTCLINDPLHKKEFLYDWLPGSKLSQRPLGLVVNTHPHNQPGERWLTLYLVRCNHGEFFDSFGHPPE